MLHRQSTISSGGASIDRKSTRLNSSHVAISYAVFCSKKKRSNGVPILDITGPLEENLVEVAGLLAAPRGAPVPIWPVSNPDAPAGPLSESGPLLPGPH